MLANELRVLLKLVTAKDTAIVLPLLARSGIAALACSDAASMAKEISGGAGAVVIAEEAIDGQGIEPVLSCLQSQPPWSDLPVIVVARSGLDSPAITGAIGTLGNVTVLERPMRVTTLVSTVRSALVARKRQYQLRSTLDGLREADQRKTEFLATLAHELRNPLAPLRTALTIVSKQQLEPDKLQALYAMMDRQVTHMVRLIDDLMEVSRISRGKITLRTAAIAVDSVLRDAVEVNRPLLADASQQLVLDLPEEPCHVRGDAVRLTQVFANLLNNASKFTPSEGHIRVSMRSDEKIVRVQVTDTGIGIPEDMLEAVFGMFVQIHSSLRGAQGGLGVGLTLARSLVELHGGRISVTSPGPHAGTTVTVELPRVAAPVNPHTSDASTEEGNVGEGHQILVVDDNRDAADSLAQLFAALGAKVSVAYGGEEALSAMAAALPSIAFIDIGMPVMDGYELAARIRASASFSGVVLVALTGWGQATDRERILNSGFDHHLIKPADVQQLIRLLQSIH
ncbi:ATP-binding protein [Hydrogenophaga sp. A37]|uniref:ATP-binding response regulator n=1 Tax=Hydrogenophaga sp. A37 TaxID=1945864 RepID=UPI00209AC0AC|nr:ATP-binding protein [Hydrogenophaga sp. A37]